MFVGGCRFEGGVYARLMNGTPSSRTCINGALSSDSPPPSVCIPRCALTPATSSMLIYMVLWCYGNLWVARTLPDEEVYSGG